MNILRQSFGISGSLNALITNKFKRNLLIMTQILPLDIKTVALDELLPAVLLRGCEKYPTNAEIKRQCENLYGASLEYYYSYFGDNLMINYCVDFLSDSAVGTSDTILRGAVELMSQVWLHPVLECDGTLNKCEIKKAQAAFNDAIRAADNDTAAYALRRTRECVCKNDSNGYSVSVDDIDAITAQSLTERYDFLRCHDNSRFFYVGDQSIEKVTDVLNEYFGDVIYSPTSDIKLNAVASTQELYCDEQEFPVAQGKLALGITTGITMTDQDCYAMLMAVEVFGGCPTSKLFVNVRERLGLCYYCNASYSKLKGIVYVSSGIDTDDYSVAKAEILNQIEMMKKGIISDDELTSAKMSLINAARQLCDRPYSMWSFCNTRLLLDLSTDINYHVDKINFVTIDDIVRVTRDWQIGGEFFVRAKESDMTDDD